MKPALLVIDVQNVWLDKFPELKSCVEKRTDTINEAIAWFREKRLPVIAVYHKEPESGLVEGIEPFEFPESIDIKSSDVKVVKRYPNSFGKTGLQKILKEKGCDTVVLSGLSAGWCVLATYFGSMDWDLRPYMLKGGIADSSEGTVKSIEEAYETIDLAKLEQSLK